MRKPREPAQSVNGQRVVLLGLVLIVLLAAVLIAVAVLTRRAHEERGRARLSQGTTFQVRANNSPIPANESPKPLVEF